MILVMLAGCELNEEVIRNEKYAEKIKIRESSLDKLLDEGKFLTAYNKVYANRDKSRTAMEAQYNFTIVPHGAKVIEDGTKTSYTFKITREISNPDFFENLVINVDSLGQSSAYLLKYTPSEPSHPSSHNSFTFKGDIKLTPIVYDVSEMGKDIVCHTATVMMCNEPWTNGGSTEPHAATAQCNNPNHLFSVTTTTCDVVAGGGSMGAGAGQYTGGNNTGGQSGSGGGGDETPTDGSLNPPSNCPRCPNIITVPVEDIDSENTQPSKTPCGHLKNLVKTKPVQDSFKTLDDRKYQNAEWGFGFQTFNTSGTIMPPSIVQSSHTDPNKLDMSTAIGGNFIGASHTHPISSSGYYPMFSLDDIEYLLNVSRKHNNNGQPKDYSVYILTLTVPEGVFAIKIKDPLKFYTNFNSKKDEIFNKIDLKYDKIKPSGEMDKFKMAFLDIIDQFDLGIGLYQASTEDIAVWGELVKGTDKKKPDLINCD